MTATATSTPALPPTTHKPRPYSGPSKAEVLALRQQYLHPGDLSRYYREPLMIVEGHMQYVWDETGRRYLDVFAGIVTVVVRPLPSEGRRASHASQVGKLQHTTTIYLHPTIRPWPRSWPRTCRPGWT